MGLDQKFMNWVVSIFCCLGQVGSATSGFGKFPLKIPIFLIFFPLAIKKYLGQICQHLIYCGSIKVCLGQVRAHLYLNDWVFLIGKQRSMKTINPINITLHYYQTIFSFGFFLTQILYFNSLTHSFLPACIRI